MSCPSIEESCRAPRPSLCRAACGVSNSSGTRSASALIVAVSRLEYRARGDQAGRHATCLTVVAVGSKGGPCLATHRHDAHLGTRLGARERVKQWFYGTTGHTKKRVDTARDQRHHELVRERLVLGDRVSRERFASSWGDPARGQWCEILESERIRWCSELGVGLHSRATLKSNSGTHTPAGDSRLYHYRATRVLVRSRAKSSGRGRGPHTPAHLARAERVSRAHSSEGSPRLGGRGNTRRRAKATSPLSICATASSAPRMAVSQCGEKPGAFCSS